MQEQFDVMKNSFLKTVEDLNSDINNKKIEFRRKVYDLEEELSQTKHVKDVFLKQITELQRKI